MRRAAGFHRDRIAIRSGGRELTFGEAWERGLRLANGLAALGIRPGDRVAVLEDNCLESSDFFLGVAAGNVVRVPLYRRNARESHAHMLRQTNCRALVVAREYLHEVEGLERELPELEHVIVRDEGYEDWLAGFPADDPDPQVGLDDLHLIRHSAGTTGKPKGIAFTHRSWMATERDWLVGLPPFAPGDVCQHAGPISHGSGYLFVPAFLHGATNLLEARFDARATLDTLATEGGYFFAVPTMVADMCEAARGRDLDLSKVKAIVISAAPIRRPTALAAHEVFGDTLYQLYGQTEAVPVVFMGPEEWFTEVEGSRPLDAAGRIMAFAEVEIRDEENRPVPNGTAGEIAVRCDGQMTGIWGDEEMSARRLVDGWVLTGDIGEVDDNGYLYVVDRKDDLIISGGFNIWPAELESVIVELPGVREVAVFGVPHERWGETPMALVVVEEDHALDEDAVIAACTEKLGSYKKPAAVRFRVEPLPRSIVGKIQRKVLRAPYWDGSERLVGGA
ncbi:MAG: class I adenylate-forming enzyme family protein [Solirubrobacteraceae bacterium]